MNVFEPVVEPDGNMHVVERRALACALGMLRPDLVVEVGTEAGASARLFSKYADRVVTMDRNAGVGLPLPANVIPIQGESPKDLDRLHEYTGQTTDWIFVHDSTHNVETFLLEALWAFRNGAHAVLCHDQGQPDMERAKQMLVELGHKVVVLTDLGEVPDRGGYTGVALVWEKR